MKEKTKESQKKLILAHMQFDKKGITPIDALTFYGCFRLSARISDLRHDGYNIVSERETSNGKTYCRYRLEE